MHRDTEHQKGVYYEEMVVVMKMSVMKIVKIVLTMMSGMMRMSATC